MHMADDAEEPAEKRFKFRRLSERLGDISVAVGVDGLGRPDLLPSADTLVHAELEALRELDTSVGFKRFYYKLWPLVQSLPEVLHHLAAVVELFAKTLADVHDDSLPSVLRLVCMLCRDVLEDLSPYFVPLMSALVSRVAPCSAMRNNNEAVNPELTGKVIECISYVLKYQIKSVLGNTDQLLQFYGALLGHSVGFVRTFAAKCFAAVLKALSTSECKKHLRKVLRSVSKVFLEVLEKERFSPLALPAHWDADFLRHSRVRDLIDGFEALLFYSTKGVKGCLHSKGLQRLEVLFEISVCPFSLAAVDCADDSAASRADLSSVALSYVSGRILRGCVDRLLHHTMHYNVLALWRFVLSLAARLRPVLELQQSVASAHPLAAQGLLYTFESIVAILTESLAPKNRRKVGVLVSDEQGFESATSSVLALAEYALSLPARSCLPSAQRLFCLLWTLKPASSTILSAVPSLLPPMLQTLLPVPLVVDISADLLDRLPADIAGAHLVPHLVTAIRRFSETSAPEFWLPVILNAFKVLDTRKQIHEDYFKPVDESVSRVSLLQCDAKDMTAIFLTLCKQYIELLTRASDDSLSVVYMASLALIWITQTMPSVVTSKQNLTHSVKFIAKVKGFLFESSGEASVDRLTFGSALQVFSAMFVLLGGEGSSISIEQVIPTVAAVFARNVDSVALTWAFRGVLQCMDMSGEWPLVPLLGADLQSSMFNSIVDHLSTGSHWLRINLLKILSFFPPPRLKVLEDKHDDDDVFDVVSVCLEAALLEVSLESARDFARIIGSLEVVVRSGRLDGSYVRMVMSFCLGMLHVKFQSYWEPLILVIAAVGDRSNEDDSLWQLLLRSVERLSEFHGAVPQPGESTIDLVNSLACSDDGKLPYHPAVTGSGAFMYSKVAAEVMADSNAFVSFDARTDDDTMFANLWSILKRCPSITLRRSKAVVPIFLSFLRNQFYTEFFDEPEVPDLIALGLLLVNFDPATAASLPSAIPRKSLKIRLEVFLSVFAAVKSPKQLYQNALLFNLYVTYAAKSDVKISKVSLECLLTYKPAFLTPIKENVLRITEDKTMRDELVSFDISRESEVISKEHHPDVICLLSFILYSKFSAKSGGSKANRDQGVARKNGVLTFLCQVQGEDLVTFIHLVLRGILSSNSWREKALEFRAAATTDISFRNTAWWKLCQESALTLSAEDIEGVSVERRVAFLRFVDHLIRVLGHRLDGYVGLFVHVIVVFLRSCQTRSTDASDAVSEADEAEEPSAGEAKGQPSKLRPMCLQLLTTSIEIYSGVFDFSDSLLNIMEPLEALVHALPSAVRSSHKPPALLKLIRELVLNDATTQIVARRESFVVASINCLAFISNADSVRIISEVLLKLLSVNNGIVLHAHTKILIDCFCKRFLGSDADVNISRYNLSELNISPNGSIKQELSLLIKFSEVLFKNPTIDIDSESILNLATLLLGMLRSYINSKKIKVEVDWVLNILGIYIALSPRLETVLPHLPFISRLFGPTSFQYSLLNNSAVRKKLIDLYSELSTHVSAPRALCATAESLVKLTAFDKKQLEVRDFSTCIPVLQGLAGEIDASVNWSMLLGPMASASARDASFCHACVYECVRMMYDDEVLIRGAVLAALKKLVDNCWLWSNLANEQGNADSAAWFDPVVGIVMPGVHRGLQHGPDAVRKGFVGLLAHVVAVVGNENAFALSVPQLHGDMTALLHVDVEQDFFENVFHIQSHRRGRALARVRAMLEVSSVFTTSTLANVLLPIAYYYLTSSDFYKKGTQSLVTEAAQFIGVVCSHLPWSQYFAVIKFLLKQLDQHSAEKERFLLNALCLVLDSFHFDIKLSEDTRDGLTADEEAALTEKSNISQCVLQTVLPWVRVFLLKDEKDHKGNDSKTVRPLVAVALAKLIARLEPPLVSDSKKRSLIENLILNVVGVLKSRDSDARDAARDSLGRIVTSLGMSQLHPVLFELDKSLQEGYQRHVRNYAIWTLLGLNTAAYVPSSAYPSLTLSSDLEGLDINLPDFDKCVPLIVSSALDDLIGNAHENRTATEGTKRTLIREAKGSKSNDILELCAQKVIFRPSFALIDKKNPASFSSVHALVSPILEALSVTEDKVVIGRLGESLSRIALGLSKNLSLTGNEALVYIYSTLHPLLSALLSAHGSHSEYSLPTYLTDESFDEQESFSSKPVKTKNTTWLNSSTLSSQRSAVDTRNAEQRSITKVEDGASAPVLTGINKYKRSRDAKATPDSNPACISAIKFCLSLLYHCLKGQQFDYTDEKIKTMLMPFLDILMSCLQIQGAADVVASTMRSMSLLLMWEKIEIDVEYRKRLSHHILKLMFRGGALISTDSELVQACLKGLVGLFRFSSSPSELPLDTASIRDLLQMLSLSVMQINSPYQNVAFQLIRSIVECKVVVPELYDIVSKLVNQIVLSQRKGIRDASSAIIVSFLINYPLGDKKLVTVLQQIIVNCSYEFEDGRLACLDLLALLAKVLPLPLLEDNCQLLFFPLTLRLINETSSKCRQKASYVLSLIVQRIAADVAAVFVGYALKWLGQARELLANNGLSDSCSSLILTGSQIISLVANCRVELLKRQNTVSEVLDYLLEFLSVLCRDEKDTYEGLLVADAKDDSEEVGEWVVTYYALSCFETLCLQLPHQAEKYLSVEPMRSVLKKGVLYPHAWVRSVACRIVIIYLRKLKLAEAKAVKSGDVDYLFQLGRVLCAALNQSVLNDSLAESISTSLVAIVGALHFQQLAKQRVIASEDGEAEDAPSSNGAFWIIRRLSGVSSNGQGCRRSSVLRVFADIVKAQSAEFVSTYLKYILEVVVKTTASRAECIDDNQKTAFERGIQVFIEQPFLKHAVNSLCIYMCCK